LSLVTQGTVSTKVAKQVMEIGALSMVLNTLTN